MNRFRIEFLEGQPSGRVGYALGQITIGSFEERFLASIFFWSTHDYEIQWQEALRRFVAGRSPEMICTDVQKPGRNRGRRGSLWGWPLYAEGTRAIIHNVGFILDRREMLSDYHPLIGPRDTECSEWSVEIAAISAFLDDPHLGNNLTYR